MEVKAIARKAARGLSLLVLCLLLAFVLWAIGWFLGWWWTLREFVYELALLGVIFSGYELAMKYSEANDTTSAIDRDGPPWFTFGAVTFAILVMVLVRAPRWEMDGETTSSRTTRGTYSSSPVCLIESSTERITAPSRV